MKPIPMREARTMEVAGSFSFRCAYTGAHFTALMPTDHAWLDERILISASLVEAGEWSCCLKATVYV